MVVISAKARQALGKIPFVTESKIITAIQNAGSDPADYMLPGSVNDLVGFDPERRIAFIRLTRTTPGYGSSFEGFHIAKGEDYLVVLSQYEAATGTKAYRHQ